MGSNINPTPPKPRAQQRIRGLYAITPDAMPLNKLVQYIEVAILGGLNVLQYRRKQTPPDIQREEAQLLRQLTAKHRVTFIVNDDALLAREVGADGVHWGRDDVDGLDIMALRERITAIKNDTDMMVGISCYDDLSRAEIAASAGADYLAFGSFFYSPTKPRAPRAEPLLLKRAKVFGLPVVAIGGITRDNAVALIDKGADALAVISDLFDSESASECRQRSIHYRLLFSRS